MAWTIEVINPATSASTDITNKVRAIQADSQLGEESAQISLECYGITTNYKLYFINISEGGTLKYGGVIINQSESGTAKLKWVTLKCADWSHLMNWRIIAEIYSSQNFSDILVDVITKGVSEFTTTNVTAYALSIDNLDFRYIYVKDAVNKLFEHAYDWYWYVDENKDLHSFYQYETEAAAFEYSLGSYNFFEGSLSVEYVGDKVANRLWLVGSRQADTNFIDQYFPTDGVQTHFTLSYEPNYTVISLDTGGGYVVQDSCLEKNDDGLQDFLIDKQGKVVYAPTYTSPPATGTLKVHYRPTRQLIDYYENYPNQVTTGLLIESVVKDKDVTDRAQAIRIGKALIKKKSNERRIVKLDTDIEIKIGEKRAINVVTGDWNIVGNFVVKSVNTSVILPDIVRRTVTLEELI
jgi:hypothetical protein